MTHKEPTKEDVLDALKTVIDPEVAANIVDLGLVYEIVINDGKVKVIMTLTTPMCPLGPVIVDAVKQAVEKVKGVKAVDVEVVFEPPWSIDRIRPEIREKLGLGI